MILGSLGYMKILVAYLAALHDDQNRSYYERLGRSLVVTMINDRMEKMFKHPLGSATHMQSVSFADSRTTHHMFFSHQAPSFCLAVIFNDIRSQI